MLDKMKKILADVNADYADLRFERKGVSVVSLSKNKINDLRSNTTDGYVLRVLKKWWFSNYSI
jgi:TldD protein